MLKKLLCFSMLSTLLISCESYDWHTKLIFEGRIVDQNGNPVQGVTVSTYIHDNYGWFSYAESEIISYTKTDGNGYYRMMFPDPQSEDEILLLINKDKSGHRLDPSVSDIVIRNIREHNFNDFLINFGDQRIFREQNSTAFNLSIIDDPAQNAEISDVSIEGMIQQNSIDYNIAGAAIFYEYQHIAYTVAINQAITINYTLMTFGPSGPEYSENSIVLQVGTEPIMHTINY